MCDVRNMTTEQLQKALAHTDAVLSMAMLDVEKAEYAFQIATENRLYNTFLTTFERRARSAISSAMYKFNSASGEPTKSDATLIAATIAAGFRSWPNEIASALKVAIEESYARGLALGINQGLFAYTGKPKTETRGVRKAGTTFAVTPEFALVDERAIGTLVLNHQFWIGEFVDTELNQRVKDIVSENLRLGLGRKESGKALQQAISAEFGIAPGARAEIPRTWSGTPKQYFDGFAANVITTARVGGTLRGLRSCGVERYEVIAVGDDRTCEVCSFMDGKVFDVGEGGRNYTSRTLNTAEQMKLSKPWLKLPEIMSRTGATAKDKGRVPSGLASKFAKNGLDMPSYHYRCRCILHAAEEDMEKGAERTVASEEDETAKPSASERLQWSAPPTTPAELHQRVKMLIVEKYGPKAQPNHDLLRFNSPKVPAHAYAMRSWDGVQHYGTDATVNIFDALRTGSPGSLGTKSIETFVHETHHSLGKWKSLSPNKRYVRRIGVREYQTPLGRALEEGSVELTANRDTLEYLSRLGFTPRPSALYPPRHYANGEVVWSGTYRKEVSFVEALCNLAVNKAPEQVITGKAEAPLRGLLYEWAQEKRPEKLINMMVKSWKVPKADLEDAKSSILLTLESYEMGLAEKARAVHAILEDYGTPGF